MNSHDLMINLNLFPYEISADIMTRTHYRHNEETKMFVGYMWKNLNGLIDQAGLSALVHHKASEYEFS